MRNIGYIIVGWNFGMAWAAFFGLHGPAYTTHDVGLNVCLAFTVWTTLIFGEKG